MNRDMLPARYADRTARELVQLRREAARGDRCGMCWAPIVKVRNTTTLCRDCAKKV